MHSLLPRAAAVVLALATAAARAEQGFGQGNWGGSSVQVGRTTFYANGLVANRVGRTEYFNNGLVGRRFGNLTLYNNGLVAADAGPRRYFSNLAVGVPVRPDVGRGPAVTVYGGGFPYPLGPGPAAFAPPRPPAAGQTPWATTPWSRTPWGR